MCLICRIDGGSLKDNFDLCQINQQEQGPLWSKAQLIETKSLLFTSDQCEGFFFNIEMVSVVFFATAGSLVKFCCQASTKYRRAVSDENLFFIFIVELQDTGVKYKSQFDKLGLGR